MEPDSLAVSPATGVAEGGIGAAAAEETLGREPGMPPANQAAVGSRPAAKGRGVSTRKLSKGQKDTASSSSSTSSSSSSSRQMQSGFRLRSKRRPLVVPRASCRDDSLEDLALPLGMSFAAVVAQVLDGKNVLQQGISVDRLSQICTSAVKESVHNIYGDRFDCFMRNFEKSFGSTFKTLKLINEAAIAERVNISVNETPVDQGNASWNSFIKINSEEPSSPGSSTVVEELQGNLLVNSLSNELILHGQVNQQLVRVSETVASPVYNQSILNTIEKSVMEQTRCNDLKAVEIGLIMRKLQLKQSQLALNSYANMLEKIKISMGFSKASFKEEKLKNQMQDMRNTELLKRSIDLLVAGLVIMSSFLAYGASVYSYQRITEATSSCTSTHKDSRSWWVPNPMSSFSSSWHMLRCHVQVLTRMLFGLLMILAIAYSIFQRSAVAGPSMPVTFLLLLGVACGVAGKLCVDTLGGNGYQWLLYWEALCVIHFFANVFPSALYYILYGPVTVSQGARSVITPYWIRRYTFYAVLLLILPTLAGLLPFASICDWKEHFNEKITIWRLGNESEG